MNFDYTYVILFGRQFYEPMVIVTNFIMLLVAIYCFRNLIRYHHPYPTQMASFIIVMGVSSCFGAAAHAMHYQLGTAFFDVVFFISNMLNLIAIYFCFRGSYTYYQRQRGPTNKYIIGFVVLWVAVLLVLAFIHNNFLMIKIHAGIVLVYSLIVHYLGYKKGDKGSGIIVAGILISFLSILVHSLKFSLHAYFNYKDIAHVIMIISLIIIYRGIKLNADKFYSENKTGS